MATETPLDSVLSRGGRLVEVVQVDADDSASEESGVIWRCGCGAGSDWPFATDVALIDPVKLTITTARTHADLCDR